MVAKGVRKGLMLAVFPEFVLTEQTGGDVGVAIVCTSVGSWEGAAPYTFPLELS